MAALASSIGCRTADRKLKSNAQCSGGSKKGAAHDHAAEEFQAKG